MKHFFISALLVFVVLMTQCGGKPVTAKEEVKLKLRWVKAYETENWTAIKTGLYWTLSYLGAELDTSEEKKIITRIDSSVFELNLSHAGFDEKALDVFRVITDSLKASGEYQKFSAVDLGRFVVASAHISEHYYAITGAAENLGEFRARHNFSTSKIFAVMKSCVAKHHRIVRCLTGKTISDIAFIAEEGTGSPDSGNFEIRAYEVFDVMKNGQLRFAIYDVSGKRLDGSPRNFGEAGKPGKCNWCHESIVQPLFFDTPDVKSYISKTEFLSLVKTAQDSIDHYRSRLHPLIRYNNKSDHTCNELLYISFMEPSAKRLANEWKTDSAAVIRKLNSSQPTHIYDEFPFLGSLYHRYYADSLAPYSSVKMPGSVRETYGHEPSLIKKEN